MADAVKEVRDLRAEVARLRERVDAADGERLATSWPRIIAEHGICATPVDHALVLSRTVSPLPRYRYFKHSVTMHLSVCRTFYEDTPDRETTPEVARAMLDKFERRVSAGWHEDMPSQASPDFDVDREDDFNSWAGRLFLTRQPWDGPAPDFTAGTVVVKTRKLSSIPALILGGLLGFQPQHEYDPDYGIGTLRMRGLALATLYPMPIGYVQQGGTLTANRIVAEGFRVISSANDPDTRLVTEWEFEELVDGDGNPREPTQGDFNGDMARFVFWGEPPENPQEPQAQEEGE